MKLQKKNFNSNKLSQANNETNENIVEEKVHQVNYYPIAEEIKRICR